MSKIPKNSKRKISEKFQARINDIILNDHQTTPKKYAELLNLDRDTIARASNYGIIPTVQILIKIADYEKISLVNLLGEAADEEKPFYPADPPSTFHVRLIELKDKKQVKFSQIGYHVIFPYRYFYDWIRDETIPSLEYLESIAQYFVVSIDYLLGRTDDKN